VKQAREQLPCYLLHSGFFLGQLFDPENRERFSFNGLHGVISYKTEFFITTAVRICNPTRVILNEPVIDYELHCFGTSFRFSFILSKIALVSFVQ
jgi:hypothetical protein